MADDPSPPRPSREPQPNLPRREIDGRQYIDKVRRGMIFMANVLPAEAKGHEQQHDVPSPWLIVSSRPVHKLKLVQAIPLSSKMSKDIPEHRAHRIRIREDQILRYDLPEPITGFREGTDSLALVEQVRVLSHDRLVGNPVARVPREVILVIEVALKFVFGMDAVAGDAR